MRTRTVETDVVVVGGGLAGVCAAVAAAREGRQVALVTNRPVLGGNSSSEVRVWVCGATAHGNQRWARETGIIGEMYLENQYRNPEGNPIHWDDVVLDTVRREENISLHLNTDVREVQAHGPARARRIDEVTGWTMGAEILTTFRAPAFLDCTGDGLIGHLAGARYRLGKEARAEFDEPWAPPEPVREFLGSTLLFYTRDAGHPVKYVAPESAIDISATPIPRSRIIRSGDSGAHYWWIEWGGELDIVHDDERIRDELRGVILGIWDHIKNSGEFDAENLVLEWIGNVPGKREYRRFIGDYTLHQGDVISQTSFEDAVAFGGWSIDLHPPQGMYADGAGALQRFSDGVFEIPYRCLYSADVENLWVAGRDISATHIAFGAARVMATCGAMGQAAGTAAAIAHQHRTTNRGVWQDHLAQLRQTLLRWDAPVVGVATADPDDLAARARVSASSTMRSIEAPGPGDQLQPLEVDLGLVLPVHPRLDAVELLVTAHRATTLQVEVHSTGKPQNVVPAHLELSTQVEVPAGERQRVHVPLGWAPRVPQNAVVVLCENPHLEVATTAPLPPGVLTLVHRVDNDDQNVQISDEELLVQWPTKPLRGRCPVFTAMPESEALAPERAVSGFHRNHGGPHLWASAPRTWDGAGASEGPEWLRLDWEDPVRAAEVRLVLDDDLDVELNTLHHHRTPQEIMTTLVRDYRVEVLPATGGDAGDEEGWVEIAREQGNRHRLRIHAVPEHIGPLRAARLLVDSTNGAPQARVVAFRVQETA